MPAGIIEDENLANARLGRVFLGQDIEECLEDIGVAVAKNQ